MRVRLYIPQYTLTLYMVALQHNNVRKTHYRQQMAGIMDQLQKIRDSLKDRNLAQVARKSGVHVNTLQRIRRGEVNPRYSTIKTLQWYLFPRRGGPDDE